MAAWTVVLAFSLLSLESMCFVFDAEEIKSLNYVVDILDQPVLLTESAESDGRSVRMYNRAGQPYSCQLPDTAGLLSQQREEPADAAPPTPVPDLLAGMAHAPCLQRTRDWWTYELCPMAEIRQYHMEGGQIVGKVSSLGRFESDYDWSTDDGRSRNAKQRYHSQFYTNGSECDLTGRPRSAEVRYVCEEGGSDALVRVDEPETCRYVLTVQTARTCSHRVLGPPPGVRPQPVTCRPALTGDQLRRLAAARLRRTETDAIVTWADQQSRQRPVADGEQAQVAADTLDITKTKYLFEAISLQTKKLGNVLDNLIHGYISIVSEFGEGAESFGLDRLYDLRDKHREAREHHSQHAATIMELFSAAERGEQPEDLVKQLLTYTRTVAVFSEVAVGITHESRRLKQFLSSDPSVLTYATVEHLAKTVVDLSSLLKQLDSFFEDMKSLRGDLLALTTSEPDDADQEPTAGEDRSELQSDTTTDTSEDSTDNDQTMEETEEESETDVTDTEKSEKKPRVKFTTLESLRLDKMIQVSEIDRQQRSKIERAVKEKLGKVGLDKNGPDIKVRFLKYPDINDLEKEYTLSEEEMSAFENALVAIMMGGQEALVEHDKSSQQARNYDYSFERAVNELEAPPGDEEDKTSPVEDEAYFTLV